MGYFGIPFRNGVPIGLGSVASFGAQQFDPSSLFIGGTVGTFYDPSDPTTLFTTSTGTTPCAVPGSGSQVLVGLMLDKSQGAPGALGAELVTNGDFSQGSTGWTPGAGWSIAGGVAIGAAANTNLIQSNVAPSPAGKTYRVTLTIVTRTTGSIVPQIGGSFVTLNAVGTYTFYLNPTLNDSTFYIPGSNFTGTITNISIRQIPGNHAIAFNDTTARPELSARVNLLVATATLSTQNVTTQATSYTLCFAGTGSITLSGTATGSYSAGTHTITCTAGTLTLTVSGTVTTADLRPANSGALLPAYQAVVDANTYDSNGFPSYLRFDGVDDSMYTPASINFSGTDKMSVFAGVRKLSDANTGVIASTGTSNGCFEMFAVRAAGGSQTYAFAQRTTTVQEAITVPPVGVAPDTAVVTGISDIGAPVVQLRRNSTLEVSNSGAMAAGNFGNFALSIGSRANTSLFFNGHLYSLITAGTQLQSGSITATEQYVAGKTGVQL